MMVRLFLIAEGEALRLIRSPHTYGSSYTPPTLASSIPGRSFHSQQQ
jgi:hypothetical protein